MKLRQITNSDDHELPQLIALQRETFPEYPKHTEELWNDFVDNYPAMSFNAVYENDELAGLFIYWDLGNSYYIHFIAVFPEMRNRKIGQQIMDWVSANLNKPVFLESEVPFDDITTRRLNFYKRNGFSELANDPEILSSVRDGEEHPLWLMGTRQVDKLDEYLTRIRETVYYAGEKSRIMDMTKLPFNELIGLKYSDRPEYMFMLENRSDYHNHIATVHASALFSLAEATGADFLFNEIAELEDRTPVVGKVEMKYKKPAIGEIYSTASYQGITRDELLDSLKEDDKVRLTVEVSLFDKEDQLVVQAEFGWVILKKQS